LEEVLTFENWDAKQVQNLINKNPDDLSILKWAFQEYKEEIVYACSFGAEAIVLLDLIYKVQKKAKVIFLDTGLHFQETYELIDKVKERFPLLQITLVKPPISLEQQAKEYGDKLWKVDPNLCCHIRKVVLLKEALQSSRAWISGLRREQSDSRKNTQFINKDEKFKKVKICPLIHWKWEDIMNYIHLNNLPYNPLHDKGFPSIGCFPCTQPVIGTEDSRAGRWVGSNKTECGLHQN
jgi:phosphoadenosine phosphosulfate reductase